MGMAMVPDPPLVFNDEPMHVGRMTQEQCDGLSRAMATAREADFVIAVASFVVVGAFPNA